jgi:hypothetical protein
MRLTPQDRLDGASVEKLDDTSLQHDTEHGPDHRGEKHTNPETATQVVRRNERVCADREEFAVRHIDDAHQSENDRQSKGNEDQDCRQANAVEQLSNERSR